MAIDTAELLGLKMEPSKDSFTFVDSSRARHLHFFFGRAFMATVGAVCDFKRNNMCLTNVDETVFSDPMEKKKSEELISCIEMFEDPGPTADSNREPAIPESASVHIRISASVDFQSSESIDNKPSASDDSQSSESIDTKPSASVDNLRLSEQPKTEKSKSVGWTKNIKKKKKRNVDADFLPLVPLECQEGSLEYRVRCRGGSELFTKEVSIDAQAIASIDTLSKSTSDS
ncbi:hypothetical protein DY000_02010384 [Brassica cretica]|uniref:Uncharacterized protein n=1 Tax=Brassica cretica TaxID=69181 RepID=A0ABQ7C3Y4_BRACR|nr:hypothetical protein DY000_02010384 [Brassica cretica]